LRLADDAYAAGKPADAISGYEEAMADLKTGLLASRAKLGLAMAKLQAGRTADGEAALKQLAADTTEAKGVRVEASYHLASLASTAGKADEVKKYSEQILQLAPNSPWTRRPSLPRRAQRRP
jgi:tetratricopeptide (TPR) repeat protein